MNSLGSTILRDDFGRQIRYLRLSVTDRCDMRCSYCLPSIGANFKEPDDWLNYAELLRLVRLFVSYGVSHVRLTGGEPLTRKGLSDFVAQLSALSGLLDISLSTNATRLADKAVELKAAGVNRVNISLDSLKHECFARITGRDCLADVLAGIQAARDAGLEPIKLNMVVQHGVNEDEVEEITQFAVEHSYTLRFIEVMPIGSTGQRTGWVDVTQLVQRLSVRFGLLPDVGLRGPGPARYWGSADGKVSLGTITPMSQHFCATCNRVRLTVDGQLHLCLGDEGQVPLGQMLRAGATDEELVAAVSAGMKRKPERHYFHEAPEKIVRFMASTGG